MRTTLRCKPPLTPEQEQFLFQQLATARRVIEKVGGKRQKRTSKESSQLGIARGIVKENREQISAANLPLVMQVAKRFVLPGVEYDDLVMDGVQKLLQCIDNFDLERGVRFSTYLYQALINHYVRSRTTENKTWRRRVDDEDEFVLLGTPAPEGDVEVSDRLIELRAVLEDNTAGLTDVERTVVVLSFERTQEEIMLLTKLSKIKIKEYRESALAKLRAVMVKE